jgi:hypothetical protein
LCCLGIGQSFRRNAVKLPTGIRLQPFSHIYSPGGVGSSPRGSCVGCGILCFAARILYGISEKWAPLYGELGHPPWLDSLRWDLVSGHLPVLPPGSATQTCLFTRAIQTCLFTRAFSPVPSRRATQTCLFTRAFSPVPSRRAFSPVPFHPCHPDVPPRRAFSPVPFHPCLFTRATQTCHPDVPSNPGS